MKILLSIVMIYLVTSSTLFAQNEDKILLTAFHKYGITNCDAFIIKHSKLQTNWNFFLSKHMDGIDGPSTEVTIISIFGNKGDTIKVDDSYIQTAKNCFLHSRATLTNEGSCASSINSERWKVSLEMPNKDYTTYENKYGMEMQAKDISFGNFQACLVETSVRLRKIYEKIDTIK